MKLPGSLTIGIEEEYQIIDPHTRELTSYVREFLDQGAVLFRDQVKPEFLQSQIEVGSQVCHSIKDLEHEIIRLRNIVGEIANKNNCEIIAAGTHPFSHWQDQIVTDEERYQGLFDSMQYVARRLLIFGMHIHIGIPNKDLRIDVMNQIRYFLPHILMLSTSSPFWRGENTGLKSYRSIIFEDLPRTGIPEYFSSALDYESYVKTLVDCHTIDEPSKIWWDIRPHPVFPTLEFRICDCVTKVTDAITVAAFIQALVAKLIKLRQQNQSWRIYRGSLIAENKWRAIRDGIDGKLIDFGLEKEIPVADLMEEALDLVDDVLDELNTREAVERIRDILKHGTSADRQLKAYGKSGDMMDVVDLLIRETRENC